MTWPVAAHGFNFKYSTRDVWTTMQLPFCINYLLTVSQHEVFQTFSVRLSQFGITPGQYGVLSCLWSNGPSSPKEIAQILRLENSTISGVLDRMQKRGLIEREVDPNDRRSIRVVATAEGQALEPGVLQVIEELNEQILGRFSKEEQFHLMRLLREIGNITQPESVANGTEATS